ncbi:hypothetical protein N8766_03950 [bacterium]|nr:hypothetical protein [bacterium]
MSNLHTLGSKPIFPSQMIVSASEVNPDCLFVKGPFEDLRDEDFNDPYVEGVDWVENIGARGYQTIVSCAGRIAYGDSENELFPSDLYQIASLGGWTDNDECWQEVFSGGADILPDYTCYKLADSLLNVIGKTTHDFQCKRRAIHRELIWRALIILRGGPTLMPW